MYTVILGPIKKKLMGLGLMDIILVLEGLTGKGKIHVVLSPGFRLGHGKTLRLT
jgi:hypothetical protein